MSYSCSPSRGLTELRPNFPKALDRLADERNDIRNSNTVDHRLWELNLEVSRKVDKY